MGTRGCCGAICGAICGANCGHSPDVTPRLFPPPPPPGDGTSAVSPLNPGELLVALHNIDSSKCDMKSIIKGGGRPLSPP